MATRAPHGSRSVMPGRATATGRAITRRLPPVLLRPCRCRRAGATDLTVVEQGPLDGGAQVIGLATARIAGPYGRQLPERLARAPLGQQLLGSRHDEIGARRHNSAMSVERRARSPRAPDARSRAAIRRGPRTPPRRGRPPAPETTRPTARPALDAARVRRAPPTDALAGADRHGSDPRPRSVRPPFPDG